MKAFGETALASLFVGRVWFWTDASLLAMEFGNSGSNIGWVQLV